MIDKTISSIFKGGSTTYYYSTIFFPEKVKKDVFILYSFLRKADDYVDDIPQDIDGFYAFKERYESALQGEVTGDVVVDSFAQLSQRKQFDKRWVDSFLKSMEMDITINEYETLKDLKNYLNGSAEVVGLFMASIMGLSKESYETARYLGRAMQYMNFIRDIDEDVDLGRTYFPQRELRKHDLEGLSYYQIKDKKENFQAFIQDQIKIYHKWQARAEEGYKYIPYRYLIPIKTAADMYTWTGSQIKKDPLVVYKRKIKPSKLRIVTKVFYNSFKSFQIAKSDACPFKKKCGFKNSSK